MDALPLLPGSTTLEGLTPDVAVWQLRSGARSPLETAAYVAALGRALPKPNPGLAAAVLSILEQEGLLASSAFLEAVASLQPQMEETPLGLLVLAQLAERRGNVNMAARLLQKYDEGTGSIEVSILLDLVRVLTKDGAYDRAFSALRRAAQGTRDFALLSKAAKQLAKQKNHAERSCARTIRIALLSPYTTDLWVPLLRLGLFREGIWADVYVPPYGTHDQVLHDPDSSFFAFAPEVVILAPTWRELQMPPFSGDPDLAVKERVDEIVARWHRIQARLPAHLIQHNFEIPAIDSNGHLGTVMQGGRAMLTRKINERLVEEAKACHLTVLDLDHLAALYGKRTWADASYWFTAKQYPAPSALPSLVDGQITRIKAGLGLTRKVLVLDLDHTLWGGVIGEDGLQGIQIGPPSATGEAHLALQRYARELKDRGVLLAVCSKNNETDAKSPFLLHEGMHLHLDDFVAFFANWQDKPTNLRNMAKSLNLGLDSFVFVDDNPTERALVRQELPQVAVPEIGGDPARYVERLHAEGYFDADQLSSEDLERSNNYRNNQIREEFRAGTGSLDAFLAALNMTCEHGAFTDHVMPRIVQLLGKTNQFNLTTRRHTDAHLRQILAAQGAWTHYFRLKDKFDDNGLVGVVIAVPSSLEPLVWELDIWLMSCRVIGRQLENFMFNTLVLAARAQGVTKLQGLYIPTAKNGMVASLYPELGFQEVGTGPQGCVAFELDPMAASLRPANHILEEN